LVFSQGRRFVFHFELPIVDPNGHGLTRQAHLTTKPPRVEANIAVPIQAAGVARGKQDSVQHGGRIHLSFVPVEHLERRMTPIISFFVRVMSLVIVVQPLSVVDNSDFSPGRLTFLLTLLILASQKETLPSSQFKPRGFV
jgi:hypothetical protein